jgi:hypothetical protein
MAKGEERLKELLNEHLLTKEHDFQARYASVFLWGVLVGVIASYTSLFPLCAGVFLGYAIAKKWGEGAALATMHRSVQIAKDWYSSAHARAATN